MALKDKTLWERVEDKFYVEGDCWVWTGTKATGYGRLFFAHKGKDRTKVAHKVMYELLVGDVPEGLELDHLCRNRACINPEHLEPVTHAENLLRSPLTCSGRTHCKNGHKFNAENTYHPPKRPTRRYCKECQKDSERRYQLKKRGLSWL